MFRQRTHYVLIAGLVSLLAAPAFAADVQYSTPLDPVAFDNSTVKNNVGTGEITATLSGKTLTVTGKYSGLSSAATKAEVPLLFRRMDHQARGAETSVQALRALMGRNSWIWWFALAALIAGLKYL